MSVLTVVGLPVRHFRFFILTRPSSSCLVRRTDRRSKEGGDKKNKNATTKERQNGRRGLFIYLRGVVITARKSAVFGTRRRFPELGKNWLPNSANERGVGDFRPFQESGAEFGISGSPEFEQAVTIETTPCIAATTTTMITTNKRLQLQ
jgi:hypothetical protein